MRWSSRRLCTYGLRLVAAVVVLAACAAGTEPGPRSATLRILAGTVEVQASGADLAPASDGQTVASGDTVRTGADGRAVIEYFDGSVTRLDHDTTFALTDLLIRDDADHSALIDTAQFSGDSYHRITDLTESGSRFGVVTPTATASVQGTVFAVIFEEDGSVIFAVFEGTVIVETPDGPITVLAGFMVIVHPDGTIEGPVPIPETLLYEEWIFFNQCVLDGAGVCDLAALDHVSLSPPQSTIPAGDSQAYTVEAFAADGTSLGDVTSGAVISGEGCVSATCAPTVADEYEITASFAGRTAVAALTVEAGELDELRISPEAATVAAGEPQDLVVEGFDAQGNSLGPVAATLTMSTGSCNATSCVSTVVGEHAINAFFGGHSAQAAVAVTPGPLAAIQVFPADATVTAGAVQSYSTTGFDAYGNSLGPVTASYTITGGTCTGASCLATGAGTHTVIAGVGGMIDTAVLTVVTGPAARISLTAIDPYSPPLTIDCTAVTFRATIVDAHGNVVDDDTSVVQFSATGAGSPAFLNNGAVVASNGVAEITVNYGSKLGAANVKATVGSIVSNAIQVEVKFCIG